VIIRSVLLEHIRNHTTSALECAPDVNILTGSNGSGKTSVLEAISFCALAKSFVPVPDTAVIRHGEATSTSSVHAMRDLGVPYSVTVAVRTGIRKKISNTLQSSCTPRDIIGEMPLVALSPDHKSITFGGPAERRAFLDGVMAQSSKRYAELLFEHRRLIKHRNMLLQLVAAGQATQQELELWTGQFIAVSAEIVERRAVFLREFAPRIEKIYATISAERETIRIVYEPDLLQTEDASELLAPSIAKKYAEYAEQVRSREIARESTMFGPQKDDILFFINEGLVRETASQGQHKSLLIALKIAECELLHERCNERPIVLLDDVFSELDHERSARVLEEIIRMGMQCFVTTTNGEDVLAVIKQRDADRTAPIHVALFDVHQGRITHQRSTIHSAKEAA
jgi:DNA replication and repair protein RecF